MTDIGANLARARERIARAAERAGRRASDVLLIGVSKTVEVARIREAIAAGVPALGENRVQEARDKVSEIGRPVPWHLIGHLQTNKVRDAGIPVDIIADFKGARRAARRGGVEDAIIAYLARRPGTERDLAAGLGIRNEKIAGPLDSLVRSGGVKKRTFRGEQYYHAAGKTHRPRGGR